eukprot:scaffold2678_cov140-Isochrysis_galbana.AAC.2
MPSAERTRLGGDARPARPLLHGHPSQVVVPIVRVRVGGHTRWRVVELSAGPLAVIVHAPARELPVGQHHAVDAEAEGDGGAHPAEEELDVVGRPLAGPRQVVQGELGGGDQHGKHNRAQQQPLVATGRVPGNGGGEQELGGGHRQLVGILDLVCDRLEREGVGTGHVGTWKGAEGQPPLHPPARQCAHFVVGGCIHLKLVEVDEDEQSGDKGVSHVDKHQSLE